MAATRVPGDVAAARRLVATLGGRYSTEMGIDLDAGAEQADRWFLAATLFGTRISAPIVVRTHRVLAEAGVATIADAGRRTWDELVALLDAGGYVRYDFRTASRLRQLAEVVDERFGRVSTLSVVADPAALEAALRSLPGWGPVTTRLFLRELRGVWPGASPPLDDRAARSARHLGLLAASARDPLGRIRGLAERGELDGRDLESALVRLELTHGRASAACPGGRRCPFLQTPSG